MAEQRGGYQRPQNPAPVSGPGRMSRRTDGGPSQGARYMAGGDYGEGEEMMNLQRSAPMSKAAGTPLRPPPSERPMRKPTPLDAPSERLEEALTVGNPLGAGPGEEVLSRGSLSTEDMSNQDAMELKTYLPGLIRMANTPGTPRSFVRFVKYLQDM